MLCNSKEQHKTIEFDRIIRYLVFNINLKNIHVSASNKLIKDLLCHQYVHQNLHISLLLTILCSMKFFTIALLLLFYYITFFMIMMMKTNEMRWNIFLFYFIFIYGLNKHTSFFAQHMLICIVFV